MARDKGKSRVDPPRQDPPAAQRRKTTGSKTRVSGSGSSSQTPDALIRPTQPRVPSTPNIVPTVGFRITPGDATAATPSSHLPLPSYARSRTIPVPIRPPTAEVDAPPPTETRGFMRDARASYHPEADEDPTQYLRDDDADVAADVPLRHRAPATHAPPSARHEAPAQAPPEPHDQAPPEAVPLLDRVGELFRPLPALPEELQPPHELDYSWLPL